MALTRDKNLHDTQQKGREGKRACCTVHMHEMQRLYSCNVSLRRNENYVSLNLTRLNSLSKPSSSEDSDSIPTGTW